MLANQANAQTLLNTLIKKAVSESEFSKLARDKSTDLQTKSKGGTILPFLTKDNTESVNVDIKVIEAGFKIQKNNAIYPNLVKTDSGYHIIMRINHREEVNIPFEDAKGRIEKLVQRELHKQKTEQALDELTKKYRVKLFEENLKHVVIDLKGKPTNNRFSIPKR